MLSLLSYNIFYGRKLDLIAQWLTNHKPFDIMCFQEFPKDAIPVFTQQWRGRKLQYNYAESFSKRGKSYGELTLFDSSKLQLKTSHIVPLGGSKFEDRIFAVKTARTALITTFSYNNTPITLVNTHLICVHFNSVKRKQLQMILNHMNDHIPSSSHSQLILGDFNYSSLIRQKKFMRFMEGYGFTSAYRGKTHRFYYIPHQVDYIFSKHCNVADVVIETAIRFSDHLPVRCNVNPRS
ncbi:endonuclease/exonuclease/phosphatase family protein [Candidatus Roizmanbacteria bacterium]|nr:endonuclease/exonuclease/phosphatase family protein [Candidatus Roizmanbacteria bacterium]